ncbi:MAG: co-chaperone GroES [Gammaproteobacteria bacterium RIFCSPHIGHO2_02_FULL_42_13]|nr:MAG: co-chaperone GroES [Gammaproteobacteria bacterium RIFCSPHIGHO2_02_FULL_42_13]OGT68638.1 MAG: co-chaperone GroES [Gammaproteobacteria bacterium RIFCSPLOWO2_02_FULL_42_9]
MSSFRPLHDRVLVKPVKEDVSKGGIVIPDNAKEKPSRGIVEAVGPGKLDDNGHRSPMDVKKGNTVLYGKYSGTEVKLDDKELVVLREEDILGIIE